METVRFNSAILKIASRCNINCDYCYVYQHADESWKSQPKRMSKDTITAFAQELDHYIRSNKLKEFSVIFHGGEPLLFGAASIADAALEIRQTVTLDCSVDFSLQTNGMLLDKCALDILTAANIGISLSLDGPRHANDLHRLDHSGQSTFESTRDALELLNRSGEQTFLGVISVIDPAVPAVDLFRFFEPYNPPRLDFLLPDATHASPPPGRTDNPDMYKAWLADAFRVWFSEFAHLKVRWFDSVLATRFGVPSSTDIMGFGGISLVVIDTDGSYTDHDVFKIVGGSSSGAIANVHTTPMSELAESPQLRTHAHLLSFEGLAKECQTCPAVASCAGGCVMHRFHPDKGFDSPTVYCEETYVLLSEASHMIRRTLVQQRESGSRTTDGQICVDGGDLATQCKQWSRLTFKNAGVNQNDWMDNLSISSPGARLLNSNQNTDTTLDALSAKWLGTVRINSQDPLLVTPFSESIRPISLQSKQSEYFCSQLPQIEYALSLFSDSIVPSICALITDIVLVESTSVEENGIFSFSDDTAPNVIYVDPFVQGHALPPEDLADSILHEFLHQVLYHYDRESPLLLDTVFPNFPAPWRSGMRPASGFLHGTFIFTWLSKYWSTLYMKGAKSIKKKAEKNALSFHSQASFGVHSLLDMALLTPRGIAFVDSLARCLGVTRGQRPDRVVLNGKQ